jgi:uncharacterized protein YndB with AHSA1/START domain
VPDIVHDFPIDAPINEVFDAVSTPSGLDQWWTKTSAGEPAEGAEYELGFGPGYDWRARVTRCTPRTDFEVEMIDADDDWKGSRVGIHLEERAGKTWVQFWHKGWPIANEHYRISNCCWAMYLRVMRRFLEHGESVPYEDRLDV